MTIPVRYRGISPVRFTYLLFCFGLLLSCGKQKKFRTIEDDFNENAGFEDGFYTAAISYTYDVCEPPRIFGQYIEASKQRTDTTVVELKNNRIAAISANFNKSELYAATSGAFEAFDRPVAFKFYNSERKKEIKLHAQLECRIIDIPDEKRDEMKLEMDIVNVFQQSQNCDHVRQTFNGGSEQEQ